MLDLGYSSANNVSSFGLESLLWNIPNEVFTKYYSLGFVFSEVIDYLYKNKVSGLIFTEDLMMTLEKILNMELKEENIK